MAASSDQLDAAIESALARVRAFFRVDRCVLLSVSADQRVVRVRLASYSEGTQPVATDLDLAPLFPWSRHLLIDRRTAVRVRSIAELPPEAEAERPCGSSCPSGRP